MTLNENKEEIINPFAALSNKIKNENDTMKALDSAIRTKNISDSMSSGSGTKINRDKNFDSNINPYKSLEEQQKELQMQYQNDYDLYNKLSTDPIAYNDYVNPFKFGKDASTTSEELSFGKDITIPLINKTTDLSKPLISITSTATKPIEKIIPEEDKKTTSRNSIIGYN